MSSFSLYSLMAATLVLSYMAARWEAKQFADQKKLNKTILTVIRFAVAGFLLLCVSPEGMGQALMMLLLMMGLFAPSHRLTLNLTRIYKYPRQNKGIKWYHMGKDWYDSLWAWIPSPVMRFMTPTLIETLAASAAYQQLQP